MNGQAEDTNTLSKSNDSFHETEDLDDSSENTGTEIMPEELIPDPLGSSQVTEADLTMNESNMMDKQAHDDQSKLEATDDQSVVIEDIGEQTEETSKTGPPVARIAPMPRAQTNQISGETDVVQPVHNRYSRNFGSPFFEIEFQNIIMPMPRRARIILKQRLHYSRARNLEPNHRQNIETCGQRMRRYGRILGVILSELLGCLTWAGTALAVFVIVYAIIIIIKRPRA